MTAIALLNSENEPYIVADTLLCADGPGPSDDKTVWLPATGQTPGEWGSEDDRWYISRLGRKTFILPNHSGLLAFSGECRDAFNFWSELSEDHKQRANYVENSIINKDHIEKILLNNSRSACFSLLGLVKDNEGNSIPFMHNNYTEIATKNFGICYVSGTGASLLADIITQKDAFITQIGGWPQNIKISATEDLAEHMSAVMLYNESCISNGIAPQSPINKYCGGFYEWYALKPEGIKPVRPRLDMHLLLEEDGITITRICHSEQRQRPSVEGESVSSLKYPLLVAGFVFSFIEIPYSALVNSPLSLVLNDAEGTLIDSTFDGYENNPDFVLRLSGAIEGEMADHLFGIAHEIKRIRLFVSDGEMAVERGFINPIDKSHYVKIQHINNTFVIDFDDEVKDYILSKARAAGRIF